MKGAKITLVTRSGELIHVTNQSADDYRIKQMTDRGFMPSGELCCRLGIKLIGGEMAELKIQGVIDEREHQ